MAELKEGFYVTLAEGAREFPGVRDGTKAKNQPIFRSLKCGLQYLCAIALFQQLVEICQIAATLIITVSS